MQSSTLYKSQKTCNQNDKIKTFKHVQVSSSKVLTYKIYKSIYTSYNFVVQKAFILRPPLSIREVNDQSGEHLQCEIDVANTSTKVQVSYL